VLGLETTALSGWFDWDGAARHWPGFAAGSVHNWVRGRRSSCIRPPMPWDCGSCRRCFFPARPPFRCHWASSGPRLFCPRQCRESGTTVGERTFHYDADGAGWVGDFPLVVLINPATVSSGEVIAGALKERGRAVLVGDRTRGKGTVQSLIPIEGGEALKVTCAEMFLPSGRRLQRVDGDPAWGVDPSDGFYVPLTASRAEAAKTARDQFANHGAASPQRLTPEWIEQKLADPQLAAAVRALSAKVSGGEFAKAGQPLTALAAHYEQMRQQRDRLLTQLKRLDRELGVSAK
jgi:hypothetical protein